MNGLAIFLIVLILIIILVGVFLALYFWYREEQNKKKLQDNGSGNSGNNGNGTGGDNGNKTITPLPGPPGSIQPLPPPGGNKNPPPKNPPGLQPLPGPGGILLPPPDLPPVVTDNFYIMSVPEQSRISFVYDPNSKTTKIVTASVAPNFYGKCSWRNEQLLNNTVLNALVTNSTNTSSIPGYNPTLPGNISVNALNAAGNYDLILTQQQNNSNNILGNQSWVYNPERKTWDAFVNRDYCLYNEGGFSFTGYKNVVVKLYVPNDVMFQWENIASDPFCSAS